MYHNNNTYYYYYCCYYYYYYYYTRGDHVTPVAVAPVVASWGRSKALAGLALTVKVLRGLMDFQICSKFGAWWARTAGRL